MFYRFLRILANIAIRVVYGKVEINGLENIPLDGPMLLASNHPNGFLEPIIMACTFPRPLHFMVRGDVFRKKWLKPILVNTNQIPIFRFKDGFSNMRKNDESLRAAYDALDEDAAIILFIEGGTKSVKTLRPFQKGLARMAADYIDQSKRPLQVLPVAINFVSPFLWRSRVMLNIGKPIIANDYFEKEEKSKAMRTMTKDIYNLVAPLAFNVTAKNRQDALNKSLRLYEGLVAFAPFPTVIRKVINWPAMKSISNKLDSFTDEEFASFKSDLDKLNGPHEKSVLSINQSKPLSLLYTILLLPLALIGLVWNFIPGLGSTILARKVLDKDSQVFRASIVLCSGVGFYFIFYILSMIIGLAIFGWKGLLVFIGIPLGFIYLFWLYHFNKVFSSAHTLSDKEKKEVKGIFSSYDFNIT